MVGGVLNIVYGISAIGNSKFFVHNAQYVFGSLKTWGWITLIIGILEILASLSLFQGGNFGRFFGIAVGALAAIGALLSIPARPFWSLAVFALSLWIIQGLAVYGEEEDAWDDAPPAEQIVRPTVPRSPS
jgi:hypothetical protein